MLKQAEYEKLAQKYANKSEVWNNFKANDNNLDLRIDVDYNKSKIQEFKESEKIMNTMKFYTKIQNNKNFEFLKSSLSQQQNKEKQQQLFYKNQKHTFETFSRNINKIILDPSKEKNKSHTNPLPVNLKVEDLKKFNYVKKSEQIVEKKLSLNNSIFFTDLWSPSYKKNVLLKSQLYSIKNELIQEKKKRIASFHKNKKQNSVNSKNKINLNFDKDHTILETLLQNHKNNVFKNLFTSSINNKKFENKTVREYSEYEQEEEEQDEYMLSNYQSQTKNYNNIQEQQHFKSYNTYENDQTNSPVTNKKKKNKNFQLNNNLIQKYTLNTIEEKENTIEIEQKSNLEKQIQLDSKRINTGQSHQSQSHRRLLSTQGSSSNRNSQYSRLFSPQVSQYKPSNLNLKNQQKLKGKNSTSSPYLFPEQFFQPENLYYNDLGQLKQTPQFIVNSKQNLNDILTRCEEFKSSVKETKQNIINMQDSDSNIIQIKQNYKLEEQKDRIISHDKILTTLKSLIILRRKQKNGNY